MTKKAYERWFTDSKVGLCQLNKDLKTSNLLTVVGFKESSKSKLIKGLLVKKDSCFKKLWPNGYTTVTSASSLRKSLLVTFLNTTTAFDKRFVRFSSVVNNYNLSV